MDAAKNIMAVRFFNILSRLFIVFLVSTFVQPPINGLLALRGVNATERLKESRQYNSLIEAVREAQQKNGYMGETLTPEAFEQAARLAASDGVGGDHFGYSVAISGDTAIVGAYQDDVGSNDGQGSAYIFVRSGTNWIQQQKLIASDGAALDYFGFSVAISGDTAVITAFEDDTVINGINYNRLGSAYVFTRSGTTWTQQAKLLPEVDTDRDFAFGGSVAISGDTIVVGMTGDASATNPSAQIIGAAYIFSRSGATWTRGQKLTASDAIAYDAFGNSVAINGDTIIVGASGLNRSLPNRGLAFVFVRSGGPWTEQQKLTASDGEEFDFFGSSVAVSGNTAIIGAKGDDIGTSTNRGSAYVFVRSGTTWTQQQKLTASVGANTDDFGTSVAINGDTAFVGTPGADVTIGNQGAVYIFSRSGITWTQQQRLTASDATASDGLGFSVAVSGNNLIAGASDVNINVPTDKTGLAYIFHTPTPTSLQLLLEESGPSFDQVAALGSVLFLRDPIPVVNPAPWFNPGADRNMRVIIFVMNLQLVPGETSSSVVVKLIDSNNQSYDIAAEDVRPVAGFDFTQVIFRLPDNLAVGTCTVKVEAHGQVSNSGTIRIRN